VMACAELDPDRRIQVIWHFMALSRQFFSYRKKLLSLVYAGKSTDADIEQLLRAILAELERMADASSAGRLSQGGFGYGVQQIRDLLSELLRSDELSHAAKARIRHFSVDHLELELLEFSPMRFTQDWFLIHEQHWLKHFGYLAGRAGQRFLEIGSFEGRSACWLLSTLLAGPECLLVCVDPFDAHPEQEPNFDHNVRMCEAEHRTLKLRGRSQYVLPLLEPASFDFIYVDGSHVALDVFADAAAAWRLARPGGVVVFDDYSVSEAAPAPGSCGAAVDGFLATVAGHYEVLFSDWQLAVRKHAGSELPRSPAGSGTAGPGTAGL
jgi:predicted O-methyltransferase YrrM